MRRGQTFTLDFGSSFPAFGFYFSNPIKLHDFNAFGLQITYTGATATDGLFIAASYNEYPIDSMASLSGASPYYTTNGDICMISMIAGGIQPLNGATSFILENIETEALWLYVGYLNTNVGSAPIQFQSAQLVAKGYGIA